MEAAPGKAGGNAGVTQRRTQKHALHGTAVRPIIAADFAMLIIDGLQFAIAVDQLGGQNTVIFCRLVLARVLFNQQTERIAPT